MKIAISGFGDDNLFNHIFNLQIFNTVDNVDFLVIKEDLDFVQFKSAKIKQALMKNVPIITYEHFTKYIL